MPSLPSASTVVSWIFYLIPIYIFVLAPLLSQIFPPDDEDTWGVDYAVAYDAEGNEIPALNLEDDSFISPEDDVPLNCPQREPGEDLKVHILSRDPLVIYIENFLTEKEADHLVDVRFVAPFPPTPADMPAFLTSLTTAASAATPPQ